MLNLRRNLYFVQDRRILGPLKVLPCLSDRSSPYQWQLQPTVVLTALFHLPISNVTWNEELKTSLVTRQLRQLSWHFMFVKKNGRVSQLDFKQTDNKLCYLVSGVTCNLVSCKPVNSWLIVFMAKAVKTCEQMLWFAPFENEIWFHLDRVMVHIVRIKLLSD